MTALGTVTRWLGAAIVVASFALAPALAEAQRARPRSDGPSGGSSSERGDTGRVAVPRGGGGAPSGGSSTPATGERRPSGRPESGSDRPRREVPSYSRPREDSVPVGDAVPRRGAPRGSGGSTIILGRDYYYGGFYPWGYGSFGLGGYWGGYYDPWYPGYFPSYYASGPYLGSLRVKVKPVDAEVFVDGYYAGRVDEFDGVFQRLHLETGPHRIEIRAAGYETLTFEVRILPDRKITYEGELAPLLP